MLDEFNRNINYLRISVTDRCNLKCQYCFDKNIKFIKKSEILSFEKLIDFINIAVKFGVNKIRITGGEPLVRNGITDFINLIAKIRKINDLSITTNGILLSKFALDLKKAGLDRINVSLDTIDKKKFKDITGGGDLNLVVKGLNKAKMVGFNNIKINCVVNDLQCYDNDVLSVINFAKDNGYKIRLIKQMNLSEGKFWPIEDSNGGHCAKCNKIRITCDGKVYPCLFNDVYFNIKTLGGENAFLQAIKFKPQKGIATTNNMRTLGG